jgi:hypothetical protein
MTTYTGYAAVNGTNSDDGYGVIGESYIGVYGESNASSGISIGGSDNGYSSVDVVFADATGSGSTAGQFYGNTFVSGSISKGGGGFLIDHPLDPTGKFLEHSFVESPDRKNIYDGVATADDNGDAVVAMPAYFEALNQDFRYQLTAIGSPAPNLHVKTELQTGKFTIGGAGRGQKISWQVTGRRSDAWARANPMRVEREKRGEERGLYRHPEAYGKDDSEGIGWSKRVQARQHEKTPPQSPPSV